MPLNDVTGSTEDRYYVVVKLEGQEDKGWQRSDAWGWWNCKGPAISDALDKTNNGAWGYKVVAAEVRHTHTVSTTTVLAEITRDADRISVKTDESK